jgi:hypothetical protein
VCLDTNEHIYKKLLGRALTDINGLAMKEVVGDSTGKPIGATYFGCSTPIDGVWATSDITVSNATIMPTGNGIGNHRLFVANFVATDIIGNSPPKVVRPASRHLNAKIPRVAAEYARILEGKIIQHRLIERVGHTHSSSRSWRKVTRQLNQLDKELGQYMRYAEKKCCKIKSGRIPFSPEASLWIGRTQVYQSLLKFHAGRIWNRGNLKQSARRCNIPDAFSLSIQVIFFHLKACVSQCKYFRKNGKYYRRKHLYNRLNVAKEKEDEEAARQILAIIQQEKDKSFLQRMNYALGKPRGGACFKVQVAQPNSTVEKFLGQDELQKDIWDNIHRKRFHLAELAPLCSDPILRITFWYNGICQTSHEILKGTYAFPLNFNKTTREILQECMAIRLQIPKSSVNTKILKEDWGNHWGWSKEETSSSFSRRHFGHYKAGLQSRYISHLKALIATLTVKRGIVLERWLKRLSLSLEKIFWMLADYQALFNTLDGADFNATNKTMYGVHMLANVRKFKLMPEEVFSKWNQLADDGMLSKILFYNIARQLRWTAGLASIDAKNCYDRITHPMASMVFQAFNVPSEAIKSMLTTIQNTQFFLCTGYGDSRGYAGAIWAPLQMQSGCRECVKEMVRLRLHGRSPLSA